MTLLFLYVAAVVFAETLLLVALWGLHLRFWRWRLELRPEYAQVEELVMPDGGIIELRRLASPAEASAARGSSVPVLLVHGLAMNHRNHDASEESSFARHLQREGRDVWLLTLRSGRPRLWVFGPAHATFGAMAKYDLPRAVEAVLARTGQAQLDYVGFSMGGMLLYASLGRTVDAGRVRRAAIFASPAKIRSLGLLEWSRFLPVAVTPAVKMRLWTRSLAFAPRFVSRLLWRRLYNPHNVERSVERNMLWNVWEDIPAALGRDFVRWSALGGELTVDGKPVLEGLAQVAVPACFFAGTVDWLAPVWTVRAGFDAWGSALPQVDKHFVVLGREHGTRADYGHCDIAFGRHVRDEVFEPAAGFLASGVFRTSLVPRLPPSERFEPAGALAQAG